MKLDKMQFAKVLVYIAGIVQRNNLDSTDINVLDDMIDIEVPQQATIEVYPKNENVERLMSHMAAGTNKIDAIREHRAITGMGLRESKDAVERYWPDATPKMTKMDLMKSLNRYGVGSEEFNIISKFIEQFGS